MAGSINRVILVGNLTRDPELRAALLTGIALTRLPDALELLVCLVETSAPGAEAAVEALASARPPEEHRKRFVSAVERSGDVRVQAAFARHFE